MRTNSVKQKFQKGQPVLCAGAGFPSPEIVEFLGYIGFDCIFVDAEHGVIGVERAQEMVRAADAAGVATVIRVPKNDPAWILGYLESGAGGVVVPHVTTADEARAAVQAVKYGPIGLRGAHSSTRAANYGATHMPTDYFAQANRETLVGIMIEDLAALENLDQILEVPHLDLCLIGPGDLSMSMGYPGQPMHPEVQERVEVAFQKVRAAGVAAGTVATDGAMARQLCERGFQFVLTSAAGLLAGAARQFLTQARGNT